MSFPRHDFEVSTMLPATELHARLAREVAAPIPLRDLFKKIQARFGDHRPTFYGHVGDAGFKVARRISYRNSFNPVVRGRFEAGRVVVTQRLHPFVTAFMVFWLGGVGIASIGFLMALLGKNEFQPVVLVPVGMFVFGVALPVAFFRAASGKNRADVERLVKTPR